MRIRLHLLAGNDDQVALARVVGGLERTAEDVVVRDGDRAETLGLGVVDELGGVDAAVVRPGGVHVQIGDDPRPVVERVCAVPSFAAAGSHRGVDLLELARDGREGVQLRVGARSRRLALAQLLVLGEPRRRGRGQLGLQVDAAGPHDRAARRGRLEGHPAEALRRPERRSQRC